MNEMTKTILTARETIGDYTPLHRNCGMLCGSACCAPDEDGRGGVYLFPGEAELYASVSWARVVSDAFGPMLVCDGDCPRGERPLGCRIFPLTPAPNSEGGWTVRMDARARAMCPLARAGLRGLDPAFVRAVTEAVGRIAGTPGGEAFLLRWAALEAEYQIDAL